MVPALCPQGLPAGHISTKSVPLPVTEKLTKVRPDDNLEAFLLTFKRVVLAFQWPPE